MKQLIIIFCTIALFSNLLIGCSGGKQASPNTLSMEEVQEVQALDSISNEIENSMEEIENSEAELQKALEEIDQ